MVLGASAVASLSLTEATAIWSSAGAAGSSKTSGSAILWRMRSVAVNSPMGFSSCSPSSEK